ncbi:hypothetical protein GETHLI_06960 [Geothrix limicola]|uniref:DUF1572 domain-containing protein n=1 Tax=Geothrix limicola TaxID=2927978 RepID=A0ABQ5QDS7_9BACT|nr:DUF1572 family protein [Geothrix limicola]GLH72194.1 hypothetical protein GETHLI_06960 [Geothrix limicola]
MNGRIYLADAQKRFQESRTQCERALAQVPAELWNVRLDPESNSLNTLLLHLSGNLLSRWRGFLTSDGEKPDRDRDSEFEDPEGLTQQALMDRWTRGWTCLFETLSSLSDEDLDRIVTIRSQPLTVVEAINRQLAHYAYHAGQVVFLAKHLTGHLAGGLWQTLSVARHGSAAFNAEMAKKHGI